MCIDVYKGAKTTSESSISSSTEKSHRSSSPETRNPGITSKRNSRSTFSIGNRSMSKQRPWLGSRSTKDETGPMQWSGHGRGGGGRERGRKWARVWSSEEKKSVLRKRDLMIGREEAMEKKAKFANEKGASGERGLYRRLCKALTCADFTGFRTVTFLFLAFCAYTPPKLVFRYIYVFTWVYIHSNFLQKICINTPTKWDNF